MATTKPLTPAQRDVLANIEHLRRYMSNGYKHYLANRPSREWDVRNTTVSALFDRGLIRTVGDIHDREMTFALTDAGKAAL